MSRFYSINENGELERTDDFDIVMAWLVEDRVCIIETTTESQISMSETEPGVPTRQPIKEITHENFEV